MVMETQQDEKISPKAPTTTKPPTAVQKRSALRGVGYEDGAAMLTPVQRKASEGGYQTEGPNAGYSQVHPRFQEKKENYHESMLPGGKIHAQRQEEKYSCNTETFSEFLGSVSSYLTGTASKVLAVGAPPGGAAVIEVAGKVSLPFISVATKVVVEARDSGGGRFEVKGKTDFGTVLGGVSKFILPFLPDIKAAFSGSYEVKSSGDSVNECMRLVQVGMQLAMQSADAMKQATPEQLEAIADAGKDPQEVGLLGSFLSWVWGAATKVVNTIRRFPADTASWSMRRVLNTIWVGDLGKSFDERLALVAQEMGDQDKVEVTRDGLVGAETGAEFEGVGKVGANASMGEATKTTLSKDNLNVDDLKKSGKTTVAPLRKFVGEVDLSKIGLKGKLTYRVVRPVNKEGSAPKLPEGKLDFEFMVAMGLLGGAISAIVTKIWSHLSVWLESPEAKSDDGKSVDGAAELSIANAVAAGYQQILSGIGRNAQTDPSKDTEVTAKMSWVHNDSSPFHYSATEVRTLAVVKKTPSQMKVMGMGTDGSVKTGYSQVTATTNVPKRDKKPEPYSKMPKGTTTESMGSE